MGVRENDAIRALPGKIEVITNEVMELRADNKIMKALLRSIHKAVVRKYGSVKGEEVSENE